MKAQRLALYFQHHNTVGILDANSPNCKLYRMADTAWQLIIINSLKAISRQTEDLLTQDEHSGLRHSILREDTDRNPLRSASMCRRR